jgi:hypothetical protein
MGSDPIGVTPMVPGFLNDRLSLEQLMKPDSSRREAGGAAGGDGFGLVLKPFTAGTGSAGMGFHIFAPSRTADSGSKKSPSDHSVDTNRYNHRTKVHNG